MRASALTAFVGSIFVATIVALPGCGDDEKDPPKEEKPQGDTIDCGPNSCNSAELIMPYEPIPACCTGPNGDVCGLDGSRFEEFGVDFDDPCQARDQPGSEDEECPPSTPVDTELGLPLQFDGCCRPEGTCGYLVNDALGLVELGLGCVDSAPFLDGGVAPTCTPD